MRLRVFSMALVTALSIAIGLSTNLASNTVPVEQRSWWPWILLFLFASVVVGVEYVRNRGQSEGGASGELSALADDLAVAVRKQWQDEAARRSLNDPYPLPVRWDKADGSLVAQWADVVRLATHSAGGPVPDESMWARSAADLAGSGAELAEVWQRVPTRRIVVLGDAGAGKTMLLVRLVLDLLAPGRRQSGAPVPVLVSLASWDPTRQGLYDWLAERLALDYPALQRAVPAADGASRITMARALLDHGLIMMVLDGLDEIPAEARRDAIAGINDVLNPSQPVVVSSRTQAYREAVHPGPDTTLKLTGAAGIQLRPVDTDEVLEYLRSSAGGEAAGRRWDPIATALAGREGGTLAEVLSTPLMATLARTLYNPRHGEDAATLPDPAELLTFPDRTALEHHLFEGFIPAAYRPHPTRPTRWHPRKAQRWLTYLAHHLEKDHHGDPNLAWWRLNTHSRSHALLTALSGLVALVALIVTTAMLGYAGLLAGFAKVEAVSLDLVAVYAIIWWLTGRHHAAIISTALAWVIGVLTSGLSGYVAQNGPLGSFYELTTIGLAAGFAFSLRPNAPSGLIAGLGAMAIPSLKQFYLTLAYSFDSYQSWAIFVPLHSIMYVGIPVGIVTSLKTMSRYAPQARRKQWTCQPILFGLITAFGVSLVTARSSFGNEATDLPALHGVTAGFAVYLAVLVTKKTVTGSSRARMRWLKHPLVFGAASTAIVGLLMHIIDRQAGHMSSDGTWYGGLLVGLATLTDAMSARYLAAALPYGLVAALAAWLITKGSGSAHNPRLPSSSSRLFISSFAVTAGTAIALVDVALTAISGQPVRWSDDPASYVAFAMLYGSAAGIAALLTIATPQTRAKWTEHPLIGIGYGLYFALLNYGEAGYGLGVAAVVGLGIALAARFLVSTVPAPTVQWSTRGLPLGVLAASGLGLIISYRYDVTISVVVSLAVGIAIGVIYGLQTPSSLTEVRSPQSALARDRAQFFTISCILMVTFAAAYAAISSVAVNEVAGPANPSGFTVDALITGVVFGAIVGIIVAASQTAWPRYMIVRWQLAITGHLPWSLDSFLTEAHTEHGVLRQNGPTYQFRHIDLQRRLATKFTAASQQSPEPDDHDPRGSETGAVAFDRR